jgi:hypothetical protein
MTWLARPRYHLTQHHLARLGNEQQGGPALERELHLPARPQAQYPPAATINAESMAGGLLVALIVRGYGQTFIFLSINSYP